MSRRRQPQDNFQPRRPLAVQLTLTRALIVTCIFQAIALTLSWFSRDGGAMFKVCAGGAAIYWLSGSWIMIQRRGKPAHGELMWLTIGFPLLVVAIYIAAPLVQRFRGG